MIATSLAVHLGGFAMRSDRVLAAEKVDFRQCSRSLKMNEQCAHVMISTAFRHGQRPMEW